MLLLSWLVYWAAHNPHKLAELIRTVLPKLNRLRRKPPQYQVDEAVEQVNQLQAVNMTTGQFLLAAVWSLMNWILDILTLWACVWAVTGITPTFHSDPNNTTVAGVALAFCHLQDRRYYPGHPRRIGTRGGGADRAPSWPWA